MGISIHSIGFSQDENVLLTQLYGAHPAAIRMVLGAGDGTTIGLADITQAVRDKETPFVEGLEKLLLRRALGNGMDSRLRGNDGITLTAGVLDHAYQLYCQLRRVGKWPSGLPYGLSGAFAMVNRQCAALADALQVVPWSERRFTLTDDAVAQLSGATVILTGVYAMSADQLRLVSIVAGLAESCHVIMRYIPDNPLYEPAEILARQLQDLGGRLVTHEGIDATQSVSIRAHSAVHRHAEIEGIAQLVLNRVAAGEMDYSDVAIVLPDMQQMVPGLRDIFADYRIPVKLSVGEQLNVTSLGRFMHLVMGLIRSPENNARLLAVVQSPFCSNIKVGDTRVYLWPELIERLTEYFGDSAHDSVDATLLEAADFPVAASQDQLAAMSAIQDLALRCKLASSPEDFSQRCMDMLKAFGIEWVVRTALQNKDDGVALEGDAKTAALELGLLEASWASIGRLLAHWASVVSADSAFGAGSTVGEYVDSIMHMMAHVSVHPMGEDEQFDAVRVVGRREVMSLGQVPLLIMPGMIETSWPGSWRPSIFMDSTASQAIGLPTSESFYAESRYLFLSALTAGSELLFTYPQLSDDTPNVPSHYLEYVGNLAVQDGFDGMDDRRSILRGSDGGIPAFAGMTGDAGMMGDAGMDVAETPAHLQAPLVKQALQLHFEGHTFSATQLDAYQRCPHAYFYRYLLRIKPVRPQLDPVDGASWGRFLHAVIKEAHDAHGALNGASLTQAAKHLLGAQHLHRFYWSAKSERLFNTDTQLGLLAAIAETDATEYGGFRFLAAEAPFEIHSPIAAKGQIDAIYTDANQSYGFIVDYKTGRKLATSAEIKRYESVQLPLYLMGAQALYPDIQFVGAIYFHTHKTDTVEKKLVMCTDGAKGEIFDVGRKRPFVFDEAFKSGFSSHLERIKTAMETGEFGPLDPSYQDDSAKIRKTACGYCDYKYQCRYEGRFS